MPLPKKLLNDDETVAVDLHPHWFHFAKSVGALVVAIALGIVALTQNGDVRTVLGWIAVIAIVFCALWVVQAYIAWTTSHFVITNDRVIYRSGWISKRGVDIPLERINNVIMRQGVFERIIGAGDLMIESAGETGQQRFTDIRQPDRVQKMIYEQINLNEERGRQVVTSTDVATQLEKLEGMLQRGTLTPEEFEAQKRRLLG